MQTKIRLKKKLLKSLGMRIKFLRNECGISQEALAFQIGIDRTYVGAIEQGKRSPSFYCLFLIANALNVSLKEMFDIEIK